ncbi:MAG: helix-turn-helix domain-containing protein [bacterium]|nr:helix-turn-helix domain-containing protein [bacterium]
MKQPQLGSLITKARKEKRLTQEELAEMCTVNVRTIQRIEAGEVNPRSYTLNIIYAALEFNPEGVERTFLGTFKNLFYPTPQSISNTNQKVLLIAGMIAGIVWLCMGIFDLYLLFTYGEDGDVDIITGGIYILIYFFSAFLFYRGFLFLGIKESSNILVVGSYFVLVVTLILSVVQTIALFQGWFMNPLLAISESVFSGISGIALGYGVYSIRDKYGTPAKLGGILEAIAGFTFAIVILAPIGLMLLGPAIICEVLVLYQASTLIIEINNKNDDESND